MLAEEVQIQLLNLVRHEQQSNSTLCQWAERFDAELSDCERHAFAFDGHQWEAVRQNDHYRNVCLRALDPQENDMARWLYVTGHLFAILYAGVLNDDFDYATEEPWKVFGRAVEMHHRFPDLRLVLTTAATDNQWSQLRDFILSFHGVRAGTV